MALPAPRENQQYVTVSPFAAGHITLPEYIFYAPSDQTAKDEGKAFRLLFDLGVRSEPTRYVPVLQKHIKSRSPIIHRPSALEILMSSGLGADDINAIAISHVHWDHHGDPEDFPNSTFLLGPGAKSVLKDGLPGTGNHSVFDPNLYKDKKVLEFGALPETKSSCCSSDPTPHSSNGVNGHANGHTKAVNGHTQTNGTAPTNGHTEEHSNGVKQDTSALAQSSDWKPIGPFPHALDLLGDGSVYIISAPGHLPGHINLLCRTSPTKWVYLGGDTFHDVGMLTGEKWITTYADESGNGRTCCIHIDKEAAQKSLDRVGELVKVAATQDYEVEPVVAHDVVWFKRNQHRLFPNTL